MALPKSGDWSELLGSGENPKGMVAQTANGTIVNGEGGDGRSWRGSMADGSRWNSDPRPDAVSYESPAMVMVPMHTRRARGS